MLKSVRPEITIGILCDEFNADIHKYNPYIDSIYVVPSPLKNLCGSMLAIYALRSKLKDYQWILVDLANKRNILLLPALLAGIRCVAGFQAGSTIPDIRVPDPPDNISVITANLSLLALFGKNDIPNTIEPEIYFSSEEDQFVEEFFRRNRIEVGSALVAMQTQIKSTEPKLWSSHKFAQLADRMVEDLNATIIFTGSSQDVSKIQHIMKLMTHSSILAAGSTNILQLAALLNRCNLFVTLDTGAMHVARATGVPMIILAGDYLPAEQWLPVHNERCRIIRKPVEDIRVDEVFLAARRELGVQIL